MPKPIPKQAEASVPADRPKKRSIFFIRVAIVLGAWAGLLPWISSLNILIIYILTFFRVPLLWFFLTFAVAKFLAEKYLAAKICAWGLTLLTSAGTRQIAEKIVSAPVLCFFQLNHSRICGATILGVGAGLIAAVLCGALISRSRKRKEQPQ